MSTFGLSDPRFKFLRQAGNTIFRVNAAARESGSKDDLYAPGQFMLRIHQPGYQTPEAIELELRWLEAMSRDAGLPLPQPVRTLDGSLVSLVTISGIPGERACSLLRWVRGRELKREEIQPHHYQALGQLMAHLHNHSAQWQPPSGFLKRSFDWEGLFNTNHEKGDQPCEAW